MNSFFAAIGNPPFQGSNHQQLYPDFYLSAKEIASCVDMIFPTGWQEPKDVNNLKKMNNPQTKEDEQIVLIDNRQNAFTGITGAEWTNIIIWKKGYDNELNGYQKILTNGEDAQIKHLDYDRSQIKKPEQITSLFEIVKNSGHFISLGAITSVRKPYGLSTDVIADQNGRLGTEKYGLEPLFLVKTKDTDIKIYCKSGEIRYVPYDYKFPRTTKAKDKYKVFVPYAWGNMSKKTGLGGAFSNIIIGNPNEVCTESYLESGCFDDYQTAAKHAKYLFTKFARALLYLNKFSQHSTTAWEAIPIQDYHEEFWNKSISEIDEELMDKYNVPQDIRNFVLNNIQTRTEANIVNFKEIN